MSEAFARSALRIQTPEGVTFAEAAASLVAFGTAWHGLVTRDRKSVV